jgi:hypothetical protein
VVVIALFQLVFDYDGATSFIFRHEVNAERSRRLLSLNIDQV